MRQPAAIYCSGGLGDQIQSEPVVRYIAQLHQLSSLATPFPEVFEHLALPRVWPSAGVSYETMPGNRHSLVPLQYFGMHTTDYASLNALGIVLPIEKKVPQIPVPQNLDGVPAACRAALERGAFCVVHPGQSWPSKTASFSWWKALIHSLAEMWPCAIVGRSETRSNGQRKGVHMVRHPSVIDVRDLPFHLTLAVMERAEVVVTNDSAPLHMAGLTTRTPIVTFCTAKRGEFVLPYRRNASGRATLGSQCIDCALGGVWEWMSFGRDDGAVDACRSPFGDDCDGWLPDAQVVAGMCGSLRLQAA